MTEWFYLFSVNTNHECEGNDILGISECRVFLSHVFQVQKCRAIGLESQSYRFGHSKPQIYDSK